MAGILRTDTGALERIAAILGSSDQWYPAAAYLDAIAEVIADTGRPHPGLPESTDYYKSIAEQIGVSFGDSGTDGLE